MNNVLFGVGLFGVVTASLILGGVFVSVLATRWPRVKGTVVWLGRRNEALTEHNQYDVSSLRMRVSIKHAGRSFDLTFNNAPPAIKVGDDIWVRMSARFPEIFHDYEDQWRGVTNKTYGAMRCFFGFLLGVILLAVSIGIMWLAVGI